MRSTNDYLRAVLDTLKYSFGELLVINVLCVLTMLPIVTIPPAIAGMYYATSKLANQKVANRAVFFEGFKKYLKTSYIWFFSNVVVIALLLFNIQISFQLGEPILLNLIASFWLLLVVWLLLQIYSLPFLIRQEQPKLLQALRNSALLWLKHGFFSLFLAVIIAVLILISVFLYPLWAVITASLIAYIANLGMVYLISKESAASSA